AVSTSSNSTSTPLPAAQETPVAADREPPAMPVSALELFSAYQSNEVAADNKYKGRLLLVSGYVESINKDFIDNPYLMLATPNEFMGIRADLNKEEESTAAQLSKGEPINLRCTGGGMTLGSPILNGCSIVPAPAPMPSPSPLAAAASPSVTKSPAASDPASSGGTIPKAFWGIWRVTREFETPGVSGCDESEITPIIGSSITYSQSSFQWKNIAVTYPGAKLESMNAADFFNAYRADPTTLGLSGTSIDELTLTHADGTVTQATTQIPGDTAFLKSPDTIVVSFCGAWFEARMVANSAPDATQTN
ncbi:MAG TPA: hypothetical protein VMI06_03915, partial [Terriglobia bacterium]|nr:hypothetical protein [Terriglobia bacterium]